MLGFHDFAGSGVVHLLGGFGALIGTYILGPRIGFFVENNEEASSKVRQKKLKKQREKLRKARKIRQRRSTKMLNNLQRSFSTPTEPFRHRKILDDNRRGHVARKASLNFKELVEDAEFN